MYLMALNNIDYIVITLFFAVIFLISYLFRRKQNTSDKFLYSVDEPKISQANSWILGFGLIEMVALGAVGALKGISGIYYVFVAILVSYIIGHFIYKAIYPKSVYEYLQEKVGSKFSAIYAIICVVLLMLLVSITVVLASRLFLSLLGWNFVNSIFGVTLLTLICLEVGGNRSLSYNRLVWLILITLSFVFVVVLALQALAPIDAKFTSLAQLAISQGKDSNFYTSIDFIRHTHLSNIVFASLATLVILPLVTSIRVKQKINSLRFSLVKLCVVAIMIICGILAIATPVKNVSGSGDSKIVTYQAQLPDGQVGYVIKSIENKNGVVNPVPGIVPPLLNAKTNLVEPDKYDYKLANPVMFRHYLPAQVLVLVVLTIMAAYMYAFSGYLLSIAKIITVDICPAFNLLKEYGEEGKLWCSRMSIVFAGGIGLFGGYFLDKFFDLTTLMYTVFSLSTLLVVVLLIIVAKYERKK